jgi:hypothetical protein
MIIALKYVVSAFDQTAFLEDMDRILLARVSPRMARPVRTLIFKVESGCSALIPGQV